MDEDFLDVEESGYNQDQRAELGLGALVCVVVLVLLAMLAFILKEAWPSFAHNGLHWFGSGGNVDQELSTLFQAGEDNQNAYTFHAWVLIYSTIVTTGMAIVLSFVFALFVSVFMVEFAPPVLKRILEPVI